MLDGSGKKCSKGRHLLKCIPVILHRLLDISLFDFCKSFNNLHTASGMVLTLNGDRWI